MQNKNTLLAFRRWQLFHRVEKRVRAYRRRELMLRFKEWRALGAWKFRLRSAAISIQKIMRGYLTRKHIKHWIHMRQYQLDMVAKVLWFWCRGRGNAFVKCVSLCGGCGSQSLKRLLNQRLFGAFTCWHNHSVKMRRVKSLMGVFIGRRTDDMFRRWRLFTRRRKRSAKVLAVKVPVLFRGWRLRRVLQMNRAAKMLQGLFRTRKARKLAYMMRVAKMTRDEKVGDIAL